MAAIRLVVLLSLAAFAGCAAGGDGLSMLDVNAPFLSGDDALDQGADDTAASETVGARPHLEVDPAEVDFEWVFLGQSSTLPLVLTNTGTLTLSVQAPEIVFATTPFLDLPGAPADLFAIAPGASATLHVRFAPTALFPPRNEPIGFVRLVSNDPDAHEIDVPIYGRTTETESPELRVEPGVLDLGIVPFNAAAVGQVVLRSQGARALHVQSVFIEEPDSPYSVVPDEAFPPTLPTPQQADLDPGTEQVVRVRFVVPPDQEPGLVYGTLVIVSDDPHTPKLGVRLSALVEVQPCGLWLDNAGFPLQMNGVVVGCGPGEKKLSLQASGDAPVTVTDVRMEPECAMEFPVQLPEGLPAVLTPGEPWIVTIGFEPFVEGAASCLLTVSSDACTDRHVEVTGVGEPPPVLFDTFVLHAAPRLDVLLVVDAAGPVAPVLARLSHDVLPFMNALTANVIDAHVGLVAANASFDCPAAGVLATDPRILTSTDGPVLAAALTGLADPPCADYEGGAHQGLEAMRWALSAPLTVDMGTPCTTDADCPMSWQGCYDGGCGGANRAFLRSDADLRVLFVSAGDDLSLSPVSDYAAFLDALRGPLDSSRVDVFAVVGDVPDGCQSDDVVAEAGPRYVDLAEATGGAVSSVCASSHAGVLAALFHGLSPVPTTFPLTAAALPLSVHVWLDGVECQDGWWYHPGLQAIEIDPNGACFPTVDGTLTVRYEGDCP